MSAGKKKRDRIMAMTATAPITIPSVVKPERILLVRNARAAIRVLAQTPSAVDLRAWTGS